MPSIRTPHAPIAAGHPGEKVVLLRNRVGLTQDALATRAKVGVATIRRLEAGLDYKSSTLVAVATALATSVSYLTQPIP
jgi:transcriptional regulator with XRE-family HTH domain